MNKLPPVDRELEKLLRDSLQLEPLPVSSDSDFLHSLRQRLNTVPAGRGGGRRSRSGWQSGVFNGITGVAVGLILLLGLNTLPGFFVRISIAGTGLAQEKIIHLSIRQQVVWRQFVVNLENETRFYLQK